MLIRKETTCNLPKEIWEYIARFLPPKALVSLRHTSKEMKEYANAAIILFINQQLSNFDYDEAKKFLRWYWQTDHYEILKNKLIQNKEMYADEICCLAIARSGDIPIDVLYEKLPSAITEIKAELNTITIEHLDLIENALAASMFVIHENRNDKSSSTITLDKNLTELLNHKLWYREVIREVREEMANIPCKHTFLNLSGIVLARVNNLGSMMLIGACLDGANLSGCRLLNGLRLDHASLRYANLETTDLSHVCLEHSDLFMTNLTHSIQWGTKLDGATFFSQPIYDLMQLNNELKQIMLNIEGANYIKDVMADDYSNELYKTIVVDLISRLNEMNNVAPEEKAAFIDGIAPLLGYNEGGFIGFFQSPLPSHLILLFNAQRELLTRQNKLDQDQYIKPNCNMQ